MRQPAKIRVLIVDDFRLVRQGLRSLLEDASGILVVGDADSSQCDAAWLGSSRPRVVLWAIRTHQGKSSEAIRSIVRQCPGAAVLLLATQISEVDIRRARQAGAAGYVSMDCTPERLIDAIRDGASGKGFLVFLGAEQGSESVRSHPLSRRQAQVLRLAASGHTLVEIAARLQISVRTAERHRAHIKQALGIHDSAGLVRYALRNGLIAGNAGAFQ